MPQRTIILTIIGIILSCTPLLMSSSQRAQPQRKNNKAFGNFLLTYKKLVTSKVNYLFLELGRKYRIKGRVQELYKGFDEHWLGPFKNPVTTKTLRDSNCFAAVNTLGVIGGRAGLDAKLKLM